MRRRTLLRAGGVAGAAALAGCSLLGNNAPPPRQSEVFNTIQVTDSALLVELADQPVLQSRADVSAPTAESVPGMVASALAALSPVGVARAAKGGGKGKGATGRGSGGHSSAPRGWGGHAKYHGGDYDDWYENHEDDVRAYRAAASTVGVAYLGSEASYEDSPPGPGRPPGGWDQTWERQAVAKSSTGNGEDSVTYDRTERGWYRVGARLEPAGNANHDFGWESVDFQVEPSGESYEVDNRWKVSPRLASD